MSSNLVFPDGVRLARLEEIPGRESNRRRAWSKIQGAKICSGFVVSESADPRFKFYAEANVDAYKIWSVFFDLCEKLLGLSATLLMSEVDDEPDPIGTSEVSLILRHLEPHSYQLAHDGFLQFGLVHQEGNQVSEVFVAPTKHFKIWFGDASLLRTIMKLHAIPEAETLEYVDEYPRITTRLPVEKTAFDNAGEIILHLRKLLAGTGDE